MYNTTTNEINDQTTFVLSDKTSLLVYLQEIIARTYKCLEKQKVALKELDTLILSRKESGATTISYDTYTRYVNILSGTESYLVNLIGDHEDISLSYIKFRESLKELKDTLEIEVPELSSDTFVLLDNMKNLRNWLNNIPESLLIDQVDKINAGVLLNKPFNPIRIQCYTECELDVATELYESSYNLYQGFKTINQCMKKDYSAILGESVRIERIYNTKPKRLAPKLPTTKNAEVQNIKGKQTV